jgi:cell division protein FtsX
VRESFFVSFLGGLGVDPNRAFATGFLFFVVTIALSLPGAVILGIENLRGLRKGPSAGAPHPTTQTRS